MKKFFAQLKRQSRIFSPIVIHVSLALLNWRNMQIKLQ